MIDSAPQAWFIGSWVLACLLLLAGGIASWVYRLPGVKYSDFLNGPPGQHPPRFFHQFEDTMRLVRADKHRLIYGLEVAGASIAALDVLLLALQILR
jgi:hypothetical protein